MSRFREELRLIPRAAWIVAGIAFVGFFELMMWLPFRQDPTLRHWPVLAKMAVAMLPGLPMAALVLVVGYIYSDARRRGMRYIMWTLLAAFIPNAIGIILYFILRDPLLAPCAHCGAPGRAGYAFCPSCGGALARACPQCRRAVEPGWSHCVSCGAELKAA